MNLKSLTGKNVLVVSPHTDDGELGCGGLVSKLLRYKVNLTFLTFCIAEESVPEGFPKDILAKEAVASLNSLGLDESHITLKRFPVRRFSEHRQEILDILITFKRQTKYSLVLCPNTSDFHQDHEVVSKEVIRAFKDCSILGYDLPWNNLSEAQSCYIELEERDVLAKLACLKSYKSQSFRKYTSENFVRSLATLRGGCVGKKFAERFEVIRLVME